MPPLNNILLYCRPGFEKEVTAEILAMTAHAGLFGYIKSKPDSGYVIFCCQQASGPELFKAASFRAETLNAALQFDQLIFARQCLLVGDIIKDLPNDDRITPLIQQVKQLDQTVCDVLLETADTNDAKQLSTFTKKFSTPFTKAIEQQGLISVDSPWRLHVFFLSSSALYLGLSHIDNSSPLAMGIPRLRMPRSAPSRSTLKLEEAFKTMLSEDEQVEYLKNGMTAVDLGACPGGWTWQLVNRGMRVIAIDNGSMDAQLMETGMVEHLRTDGFKFLPQKPVDWLVCDMVERPLHISRLISRWLTEKHCRHTAFNLKLPMKQRYDIVEQCQALIEDELQQAGIAHRIKIKQLYHDREEVTVIVLGSL